MFQVPESRISSMFGEIHMQPPDFSDNLYSFYLFLLFYRIISGSSLSFIEIPSEHHLRNSANISLIIITFGRYVHQLYKEYLKKKEKRKIVQTSFGIFLEFIARCSVRTLCGKKKRKEKAKGFK